MRLVCLLLRMSAAADAAAITSFPGFTAPTPAIQPLPDETNTQSTTGQQ